MNKRLVIVVLMFFIGTALPTSLLGAQTVRKRQLRDGFVFSGIDGKIIAADKTQKWFFELDSDINDSKTSAKAGTSIELLPSSALEKIIADMKKRPSVSYRLWGKVTKYKDKNFIFPTYFLPLSKTKPKKSQQADSQKVNDPNDVLKMPDEVVKKLTDRRIIRTEQLEKVLDIKADSILADRIGFIHVPAGEKTNTYGQFTLDALGRKAQRTSFQLLPCHALELALRTQANAIEPVRFKIAGIVTKYKGSYYLLLQRATRVYTHGNFGT